MYLPTLAAALMVTSTALSGTAPGPRDTLVRLAPATARIGLFYRGVDLTVSTDLGPGTDAAVVVTGASAPLVLQRKGRVWGLFWAPEEDVTFDDVPSLYLLCSTRDIAELAPAPVLGRLDVGYQSLRPRQGHGRREDLFRELVSLKESEGLFRTWVTSGIPGGEAGSPARSFSVHIPPRAPPGDYFVRVLGFEEGAPVVEGAASLRIERGAFVGLATSVAEHHGLAYGIFAVVAALAAGLLVGWLFGAGRKRQG